MKRIFSVLVFSCLFFLIGIQTSFAETDRIRGAERFETAVEISKTGWESSEYVIIANGFSFPDALAGGPLAYTHDAPILLTRVTSLSDETKAEIKRLKASKAIILGGTAAISEDVVEQLEDLGLEVERIGGKDRYITAALISEKIPSTQAVLANGMNFPDALAVAPYAARNGIPILLTRTTSIPETTKLALEGKINTIIVGGNGAVNESLEESLPNPVRYSGKDRFETNKAIVENLPLGNGKAYIATGQNFADALTGSVLAAKNHSPILLVKQIAIPDSIGSLLPNYQSYSIFGGETAVSDLVRKELDGEVAAFSARGVTIGDTEKTVTTLLGQPNRIDESRYGFKWYIYNKNYATYLQVGILNERVVSVASNADVWESIYGIGIGSTSAEVFKQLGKVTEEPYLIDNKYEVQFYYDQLKSDKVDTVSFIHITDKNIKQEADLTEEIRKGFEKQVFDLANVSRVTAGLKPHKWDEKVAEVARKHSRDMVKSDFLGSENPHTNEDLRDRLKNANITYKKANENIAAIFLNPIEVHMALMNSKGHRSNLLNKEYDYQGVGVAFGGQYGVYYTQIFYGK
ncbi:cell wall-binding repeat-containing protein [Bacillus nitroreducens]